jgi:hypothetical protein
MIRLIGRMGIAAAILLIPNGLFGQLTAASTYVFGTGAFPLAGSEVYPLAH